MAIEKAISRHQDTICVIIYDFQLHRKLLLKSHSIFYCKKCRVSGKSYETFSGRELKKVKEA